MDYEYFPNINNSELIWNECDNPSLDNCDKNYRESQYVNNIFDWENENNKKDDFDLEENTYRSLYQNQNPKFKENATHNIINNITKPNTITFKVEKINENCIEPNENCLKSQELIALGKKRGRKTKKFSKYAKSSHNKFTEDNVMRK